MALNPLILVTALTAVSGIILAMGAESPDGGLVPVFFGTYTGGKSKGIYRAQFNPSTGALSEVACVAETPSPSFLAWHPDGRWLYAVNETGDFGGEKTGTVTAFAVDRPSGKLTVLNQQATGGLWPCHLTVDSSGKHVLVANYGGGNVTVFPVTDQGRLRKASCLIQHRGSGPNPKRQEKPHAHGIYLDRANQFALVPDLGLDKVLIYRFDRVRGLLRGSEVAQPGADDQVALEHSFGRLKPGAGPRHLAFHPAERWAYVINELDSTITVFAYDASRGLLRETQTVSTLPSDFTGQSTTAEVAVHPSGQFVYGSNRGHDSIVVYSVDASTGQLRWVEHEPTQGKTPRNFAIDPGGRWLLAANQDSDSVVVFRIDEATGALRSAGVKIEVGKPVCVLFDPGAGGTAAARRDR
jgi:6-phosphogluconolactonase